MTWFGNVWKVGILIVLAAGVFPCRAYSQAAKSADLHTELASNEEYTEYLRWLQSQGRLSAGPWSIRGWGVGDYERLLPIDSIHPWNSRIKLDSTATDRWIQPIAPALDLALNSAFPYGGNDGAVWAGKGITTAFRFGVAARYGPLTLTLAPVAFRAENAEFPLAPHDWPGLNDYVDPSHPNFIDLPQRFGSAPYSRLDPGQSSLRADVLGVAAGISTASEQWGPATENPLILGNNAPGFAHLFLGTSKPADTFVGKLHARVLWGRLEQSPYSPVRGDSIHRFTTAAVVSFAPKWSPNLEIGAIRFYHLPWTEDGITLRNYFKLWESFLKVGLPGKEPLPQEDRPDAEFDPDNQLASLFVRWVLPSSDLELYGELGREDHSWDFRDLSLEPDHSLGYVVGLRKSWVGVDGNFVALRAEHLDTRNPQLASVRNEAPFYVHAWTRQGHTNRGQLLGSPAGYGGFSSVLAVEKYDSDGRWTVEFSRGLRAPLDAGILADGEIEAANVTHALGFESLTFRGKLELRLGMTAIYELNRNYGSDEWNLNAKMGARWAM